MTKMITLIVAIAAATISSVASSLRGTAKAAYAAVAAHAEDHAPKSDVLLAQTTIGTHANAIVAAEFVGAATAALPKRLKAKPEAVNHRLAAMATISGAEANLAVPRLQLARLARPIQSLQAKTWNLERGESRQQSKWEIAR